LPVGTVFSLRWLLYVTFVKRLPYSRVDEKSESTQTCDFYALSAQKSDNSQVALGNLKRVT